MACCQAGRDTTASACRPARPRFRTTPRPRRAPAGQICGQARCCVLLDVGPRARASLRLRAPRARRAAARACVPCVCAPSAAAGGTAQRERVQGECASERDATTQGIACRSPTAVHDPCCLTRRCAALPMRRAAAHALLRHCCSAPPAAAAAARCLSGAAASAPAVARALADTASDDALTELDLSARGKQPHADLRCINIMCEAPGEACICRLSRVLERPSMQSLHTLRLAGNGCVAGAGGARQGGCERVRRPDARARCGAGSPRCLRACGSCATYACWTCEARLRARQRTRRVR